MAAQQSGALFLSIEKQNASLQPNSLHRFWARSNEEPKDIEQEILEELHAMEQQEKLLASSSESSDVGNKEQLQQQPQQSNESPQQVLQPTTTTSLTTETDSLMVPGTASVAKDLQAAWIQAAMKAVAPPPKPPQQSNVSSTPQTEAETQSKTLASTTTLGPADTAGEALSSSQPIPISRSRIRGLSTTPSASSINTQNVQGNISTTTISPDQTQQLTANIEELKEWSSKQQLAGETALRELAEEEIFPSDSEENRRIKSLLYTTMIMALQNNDKQYEQEVAALFGNYNQQPQPQQ